MKKVIKKKFKYIITSLYYRYCFRESNLASELMIHYIPNTMKKLDGTKIDGQFFIAQLNKKLTDNFADSPYMLIPNMPDFNVSNIKGEKNENSE